MRVLNYGMVGGGPGSFIGDAHRRAIRSLFFTPIPPSRRAAAPPVPAPSRGALAPACPGG